MKTLVDLINSSAKNNPNKNAFLYKKENKFIGLSYEKLTEKIEQFALGLKTLGVKKGDKIAIVSMNNIQWAITDFASQTLQALFVPIYNTLPAEKVNYILEDSEASVVICEDKEQIEKVSSKKIKHLISVEKYPGVKHFDEIIEIGKNADVSLVIEYKEGIKSITENDVITIIYTSGTTGEHKGVMLTHKNILSNLLACLSMIKVYERDLSLNILPFSHIYARTVEYYLLLHCNGTIAFAESVKKLPENLCEVKPTLFFCVPSVYQNIYNKVREGAAASFLKRKMFSWGTKVAEKYLSDKISFYTALQYFIAKKLIYKKLNKALGGRVRFLISGGSSLPKDVGEFFYKFGLVIIEGYGLTETSPVLTLNPLDDFKFGSVGKAVPGVDLKLSSENELLAKGPNVMKGYYNRDKETKEAFDADGWFKTGDIGVFDDRGFFTITDRKKDLLVLSTGKNVAPQQLENLLRGTKLVWSVAVVGHQKRYITALISPNFENLKEYAIKNKIDFKNIDDLIYSDQIQNAFKKHIENVNKNLANFEQIKKYHILAYEFSILEGELTPTLKIRRNFVEKKYSKEIQEMYEG